MVQRKDHTNKLILPSVCVVAFVTQVPFVITLAISFLRWNVRRPDQGIRFAGLGNFVNIFTNHNFYTTILNTFFIVVFSLFFCMVLGTCLALLFSRSFYGISFFRTFIILPYFVVDSVAGLVWKTLILNPAFGINIHLATALGLPSVDFLGKLPLPTVIMLIVWQWTPFFFLILLGGIMGIDMSVIEGAQIDGARGFSMLFKIKLPMIREHLMVALMLGTINILKVFGLIYVTTQGGPGFASANLPYYTYRAAFVSWSMGDASCAAIITVAIILILIQSIFRFIKKTRVELN
jgi:sorbitol/mannitol transport system permease protein